MQPRAMLLKVRSKNWGKTSIMAIFLVLLLFCPFFTVMGYLFYVYVRDGLPSDVRRVEKVMTSIIRRSLVGVGFSLF